MVAAVLLIVWFVILTGAVIWFIVRVHRDNHPPGRHTRQAPVSAPDEARIDREVAEFAAQISAWNARGDRHDNR